MVRKDTVTAAEKRGQDDNMGRAEWMTSPRPGSLSTVTSAVAIRVSDAAHGRRLFQSAPAIYLLHDFT